MNEDYKKLYEAVSARFDIGDYESFQSKMQTPEDRKRFYNVVSEKGFDLGDYESYENRLSVGGDSVGKPQETSGEGSQTPAQPSTESGASIEQVNFDTLPTFDVSRDERLSEIPKIEDLKKREDYSVRKEIFSYTPEKLEEANKEIDDEINSLKEKFEFIREQDNELNEYAKRINQSILPIQGAGSEQVRERIRKQILDYETRFANLTEQDKAAKKKYNELIQRKSVLQEKFALDEFNKKAEQGNWFGGLYNSLLYGVGEMSAGITNDAIDIMVELMPEEMYGGVTKDEAKKQVKENLLPYIRKGTKELAGTEGTTEEYMQRVSEKNIFTEGIYGLARSAPAMVSPYMSGMYFQVKDGIRQEMELTPDLNELDEWEKQAVQTPIALAGMFLERFGFSKLAKSTKAATLVTKEALSSLPQNATKKQIVDAISTTAQKTGTKLASGFAAEAETGALQEISDVGIKEIYNQIKGKDLFSTPETVKEFETNVFRAGLAEGVGGFGMAIPTAVSTFMAKGNLGGVTNNEQYELVEQIMSDPDALNAKKEQLKAQLDSGKLTEEQYNTEINNIDAATQIISEIDETLPTEKRREAFDLITEKKKIQGELAELEVKDPDLVASKIEEKTKKLEEIGLKLQELASEKPQESKGITLKSISDELESVNKELEELYDNQESIQNKVAKSPLKVFAKDVVSFFRGKKPDWAIGRKKITEVLNRKKQLEDELSNRSGNYKKSIEVSNDIVDLDEKAEKDLGIDEIPLFDSFFKNTAEDAIKFLKDNGFSFDENKYTEYYNKRKELGGELGVALKNFNEERIQEQQLQESKDITLQEEQKGQDITEQKQTEQKQQDNAIQEQATNESVLRQEQPKVELQEVVEEDQKQEVVTEEGKPQEDVKPSKDRVFKEIEGIIEKTKNRRSKKADPKKIDKLAYDNSLQYLQESKWYENATDVERESAVRELRELLNQKEKKSPSTKKILKEEPSKKITETEKSLLKKQIKDFARGMREAAKDQRKLVRGIKDILKPLKESKRLSTRQAGTLARAALKVNFASPKSVIEFSNRVQKTIDDADYNDKLDKAKSLKKSLKPRKDSFAGDVHRINRFKKININSVDNIDEYLEIGEMLKNAIKSNRRSEEGVSIQETPIYETVDNFLDNTLKNQEKYNQSIIKETYDYLEGLDLTTEELNEVVSTLEEGKQSGLSEERKTEISEALDRVKTFYNQDLQNKIDTDDTLSNNEKSIIKRIIDGSMDGLYFAQKARVIRVIENILQNNSFADVYNVINDMEVAQAVRLAKDRGIVGITPRLFGIKTLAREYAKKIMGLTEAMRNLFRGEESANFISEQSGITDIDAGLTKRHNKYNDLVNRYNKMVSKIIDHNSSENLAIRSVFAFISRNSGSTVLEKQKEYDRRKKIVLEQEEYLSTAEGMEEQYKLWSNAIDKLGIREAKNQQELNISKDNKSIVDFFVNNFAEIYPEHQEVAEQVYNKILPQDALYTPDIYVRVDDVLVEPEIDDSIYFQDTIDTKESSMLMDTTKSKGLPKNERGQVTRTISMDFDSQMMRKLDEAFMEIYTAASINKLKKFSDKNNLIQFMQPDAASIFRHKTRSYIQSEKGLYQSDLNEKDLNFVRKLIDFTANTVAIKLLGSIYQPIKQTIPVMIRAAVNFNTLKPAGDMLSAYFGKNKELMELAQKYGTVAMRGKKSSVDVDNLNARLKGTGRLERFIADKVGGVTGKRIINFLKGATNVYTAPLEYTLEKPDIRIAKATWAAYYAEKVRELDGSFDVNKELKIPNKAAIQFANSQVAQTQNESQSSKMGDMFKNRSLTAKFIRNILFPFANFLQSLRSNMYNNVVIGTSKSSSRLDKLTAWRGFVGALFEILSFNLVAMYLRQLNSFALESLLGLNAEDDDEREFSYLYGVPMNKKEKRIFNTNIIQDIAPLPIVDNMLLYSIERVNKAIMEAKGKEYDKFKDNIVYAPLSMADMMMNSGGKFGAATDIIQEYSKVLDMADFFVDDDTYTKKSIFGDTEKDIPKDRENDLNIALALYSYYLLAPSVKEIGNASKAIVKDVEKEVKSGKNKKSNSTYKPITLKQNQPWQKRK